jgi:hypothetical protein
MSYYGPGPADDPWGHADQLAGAASAARPTAGSRVLLAVLVTVLVLVMCGGGVGALYLIGSRTSSPGAGASGSASATTGPTFDLQQVRRNDCISIIHPDDSPQLGPGDCHAGNYRVVERFDGTGDERRCQGVSGANHVYFYRTTPEADSFVLCLHKL